jgi:hypothetical protein
MFLGIYPAGIEKPDILLHLWEGVGLEENIMLRNLQ